MHCTVSCCLLPHKKYGFSSTGLNKNRNGVTILYTGRLLLILLKWVKKIQKLREIVTHGLKYITVFTVPIINKLVNLERHYVENVSK